MNIESVQIKGWMAYAELNHPKTPSAAIAVVAQYDADPKRSNWGGKTAFLEAIRWAITGRHRKSREDRIISYGCEEASVTVYFTDGASVTRSRRVGGPTKVAFRYPERRGVEESSGEAAEHAIELYLGMSADDLDATLFFGQSDIEGVVSKTSSERRRLVLQWLGLDEWNVYAKRAREHLSTIQLAHAAASAAVLHAPETKEEAVANVAAAKAADASAKAALADVEAAVAKIAPVMRHADAEARLRDAASRFQETRRELHARVEIDFKYDIEATHNEARAKEAALRSELIPLEALLRNATKAEEVKCPLIQRSCPSARWVKDSVAEVEARVDGMKKDLASHAAVVASTGDNIRSLAAAQRREAQLRGNLEAISAEMERLRIARDEFKATLEAAGLTPDGARELLTLRTTVAANAAEAAATLRHAEENLRRVVEANDRWTAAKLKLEELDDELAAARIVVDATAPSGVPARIAEAMLGELELRANALLQPAGLRFEFGWERELKDLVASCTNCGFTYKGVKQKECPTCGTSRAKKRSDELDILVDDGTAETEDVREKSGGARVLVACAIRLAAAALLRDARGSRISFALVDEPFGALDAANRDYLAAQFASMMGAVGLEQAFVVSHDAALLDALPHTLVVHRHETTSTLSME